MITHPDIDYPDRSIDARFEGSSRTDANRFVDASALATALTGSATPANVFLLGVAVQTGRLPVAPAAIERAIDLNGVAVDDEPGGVQWGRRWAHDPEAVERAAVSAVGADADPTSIVTVPKLPAALVDRARLVAPHDDGLAATLELLAADLVGFQDEPLAGRYLDHVADAGAAERSVAPGSRRLTEAVARSLHKLMAYKDEYEVARLMLLPEARAAAAAAGGPDAEVTWQLHPPALKALGRTSKLGFGPRTAPAFRALRAAKRLRGTRLDPFGRTELRRIEQALPGEYVTMMDSVIRSLTADNLDQAVTIAALPDMIRGYEELKLRRVGEYRARCAELVGRFVET